MNFTEVRVGNVCINLSCGDVGMAKHSLHGAKVSAVHK